MTEAGHAERLNEALEGRYRIERQLGEGGMATVYLARDEKHNRHVALKVLRPELAAVVGAERFLAEIETTAQLQHPHILPLFDSGEADSFLFYVMPYVEGDTLRDRIDRERQLPVDEAIGIAVAVANAMHAAHERGIIHRDIKPGNILLSQGEPLVADFGIALAVGAAAGNRLTETGLSVGTPYYMSPEQATGDQAVGPASDIFALACVLYELLIGEPPYPGSTAQAVLGKIIQGAPVSATAIRRSVPTHVDAAIRRALEKLPADRFPDAKSFATALRDPAFRHGPDAQSTVVAVHGRWRTAALVSTALAAGFAGLAAWASLGPEESREVERYPTPFMRDQEPAQGTFKPFNLSPDGSFVVYSSDFGGTLQLLVRRWDEVRATPVRGSEGALRPSVSPDGSEVVFEAAREIRVVALAGGPARTVAVGANPIWGTDDYIYFSIGGVGLGRVLPSGGAVDTLALHGEGDAIFIPDAVLPGGRRLLLFSPTQTGGGEVRIFDLESREMRQLVSGSRSLYVDSGHLVYLDEGTLMAAPFDARAGELSGPAVAVVERVGEMSVASDGKLLHGSGGGGRSDIQLVWVSRDGSMTPVDPSWTFNRGDVNADWRISPDGSRVAVRELTDDGLDIWVKELDEGPHSRLTFDPAQDANPRWAPDGETIVHTSGPYTDSRLAMKRADGTGEPTMLIDIEQSIAEGFWSPDMEWLIVRTTTGPGNVFGRDIIAARPGVDGEVLPLLTAEYDESDPALSPNGRWLAYTSNETGRFEVYVRPFPDVEAGRWQISIQGGVRPIWAPDGREIFFRDEARNMVVASVDGTGSAFRAERPEVLFSIPNNVWSGVDITMPYDVAPDGERFLMARDVAGGETDTAPPLVLVRNFDEELRERVPR